MPMKDFDEYIDEKQSTIEKLKKENQALKETLKRYLVFGSHNEFENLEEDLYGQLQFAEKTVETMFNNLLDPAVVCSAIYDDDGVPQDFMFMRVNAGFANFFDKKVTDIIGKTNSEINLLKGKTWIEQLIVADKNGGCADFTIKETEDQLVARIVKINKEIFFFQMKYQLDSNSNDRQFRENLKFTQMLVEAIPIPLFYKDMDGRYLLCNTSYAKAVIGMSPDYIIGKTAQELESFFPKEYADFYLEKDLQLIKEHGIQVYEGPIRCADGVVREYIVSKTLYKDSNGEFVGILGVMQDIDKMIKTRRELAESENRYKTLFNGISQPIIVVDLDGNIVMCNSTAIGLFEDPTNKLSSEVADIPAIKFVDMDCVRSVALTGESLTRKFNVTIDGQEHWFQSSMQLINDFFGEKVVQIISSDITELKRYQSELLKQKTFAEDSNNLKTIFLANIAHETRTPANIISGYVQMIMSGLHPDKLNEYLTSIFKNCKKLLDIIDDIVELSKIESGQVKLRHEICSINAIVEDAYIYLSDTLLDSGKQLTLKRTPVINEYEALVYADNQYINQVFKKLIYNAVTFTQRGEIEIGAKLDVDNITFFVRDTGIGIPEAKLNIIFERFRQADEGMARQYGGNGLGLSIANELVKRMDGTLSVESHVNQGSIFKFTIPYRKAGM